MNKADLSQVWLSELLKSEEIIGLTEKELGTINPEIETIIFSDVRLNEGQEILLTKIMQSCDIQKDKYSVLYIPYPFKQIKRLFPKLKNIFTFGLNVSDLGLAIQTKTLGQLYFNEIQLITCISISKLEHDSNLKAQLWNQILKPIFLPKN